MFTYLRKLVILRALSPYRVAKHRHVMTLLRIHLSPR